MFQKLLPLVMLATVAAGCATTGVPTNVATQRLASSMPTIMANGHEFVLGFDDSRFKKVAKKNPVKKLPRQGLLPTAVDNRETCSPVANQAKLGACTAFAVGKGFREFEVNRLKERKVPLSAMFLYYEARSLAGNENEATGSTNTDNMSVLANKGMAVDSTWPYDQTKFAIRPSVDSYATAAEYKYTTGTRIHGLDDAQVALSKGQAVIFAYDVMESFRSIGADGVMPLPKPGEKRLGGHAVLAVGYDSQKQMVIVRNSWGGDWADKGYFYMPYSYFRSNARDIWTSTTEAN